MGGYQKEHIDKVEKPLRGFHCGR